MVMDFAISSSLVRPGRPLYPLLVYRAAALLHASFGPRLAATPLRFANPSPPSGWVEDLHLQAAGHARHTGKGRPSRGGPSCVGMMPRYRPRMRPRPAPGKAAHEKRRPLTRDGPSEVPLMPAPDSRGTGARQGRLGGAPPPRLELAVPRLPRGLLVLVQRQPPRRGRVHRQTPEG